jgi:hypothetical protein
VLSIAPNKSGFKLVILRDFRRREADLVPRVTANSHPAGQFHVIDNHRKALMLRGAGCAYQGGDMSDIELDAKRNHPMRPVMLIFAAATLAAMSLMVAMAALTTSPLGA